MSKQLFSLEYTLPNTVLPNRAQKDIYRARIAQIQSNGGPERIAGDPETAAQAPAAQAVQAEASTSLIFCYTDKFNQPKQREGWISSRFINQNEEYIGAAAGAAAGAAVRNDVIVKWQTETFASKMNYERPKNIFVLEGMKDFGGSRGDVDLLGSVEDHDKLITEIKKLFPNGANLAQPHPDEVCDEWLTTPPNASETFWGNEIKKKGIEKGKDEKVLEAARGTDFDPEMLRIIKYLHTEGIRKFLFDAGIKKIGANTPIKIREGVSIDPKKDFYYTASFDAAPEIAGYGVGIFKQPPLGPDAGAASVNDKPEGVEKVIDNWVNTNIIRQLGIIEGYFIQPGLDCDNGFLFEISVYTKKASANLDKIWKPIMEKLETLQNIASEELEKAESDRLKLLQILKDAEVALAAAAEEAAAEASAEAATAAEEAAEAGETQDEAEKKAANTITAVEEVETEYNALRQICDKLETKLSILRYLVFLPKDNRQNAVISISIPSQDYELSITQARYNYKSFQHSVEAIKILPFNDCKFYKEIKDYLSDTEKAAFCVLQKWNCDQNDAILNALVRDSCLLSVDKPAIAATIARGGNAFLFGDKSGNGIYKNKKFYKISPAGADAGADAGAESNNYKIFPQREEPARQAETAAQRRQRRKDAATRGVAAARAALAGGGGGAGAGGAGGASAAERHRHRFSRKPNKLRRRSTRKHKN